MINEIHICSIIAESILSNLPEGITVVTSVTSVDMSCEGGVCRIMWALVV